LRIINGDPLLHDVTHVVIDEVHERDRFSDFLLITLRELLAKRRDLKLVLMSATLHAGLFQEVGRGQGKCSTLVSSPRSVYCFPLCL
jgi:ATP-dependent RNA helicase DHX57